MNTNVPTSQPWMMSRQGEEPEKPVPPCEEPPRTRQEQATTPVKSAPNNANWAAVAALPYAPMASLVMFEMLRRQGQ
jgi:hypothetical protein